MKSAERGIQELIKGLAGGKVYAMRAPDKDPGPFIIFQRTDSERWRSINNPSGIAQAEIQVSCYASTYYAAKKLGEAVEAILDGFAGDVSYESLPDEPPGGDTVKIGGISLGNDVDIFDQTDEPFLFVSLASYLVTYHQH